MAKKVQCLDEDAMLSCISGLVDQGREIVQCCFSLSVQPDFRGIPKAALISEGFQSYPWTIHSENTAYALKELSRENYLLVGTDALIFFSCQLRKGYADNRGHNRLSKNRIAICGADFVYSKAEWRERLVMIFEGSVDVADCR